VEQITRALAGNQPEKAAALLEPALETDPQNPILWTLQGMTLLRLQRQDAALGAFCRALSHDPNLLPALLGAAQIEYQIGDSEAQGRLEQILRLQPDNSTAHAMLAVLAYEKGDFPQAVHHFENSGSQLAAQPLAQWQYGESLYRDQQPGKAAEVFQGLLSSSPQDARIRYNLALCFLEAEELEQAKKTLLPLTESQQADPDALQLLAEVYKNQRDIESAVEVLQKAIRLHPEEERHYLDLAILCFDQGSFNLGAEIASIGIRNIPNSAPLYAARGIIHAQLGRSDEAKMDFQTANRLEPDKPYGGLGLSMAMQQSGEFEKALELLRDQISENPTDPDRLYLLAATLIENGLAEPGTEAFEEAEAALQKVLEMRPDLSRAYVGLAELELKIGETERAIDHFQKAVDLDPSDRAAVNRLMFALRKAGRMEEAGVYAARLGQLMKQQREEEVRRNRYRVIKAPEPQEDN
jgi:tetratricopeptide (TPR) repeat protein